MQPPTGQPPTRQPRAAWLRQPVPAAWPAPVSETQCPPQDPPPPPRYFLPVAQGQAHHGLGFLICKRARIFSGDAGLAEPALPAWPARPLLGETPHLLLQVISWVPPLGIPPITLPPPGGGPPLPRPHLHGSRLAPGRGSGGLQQGGVPPRHSRQCGWEGGQAAPPPRRRPGQERTVDLPAAVRGWRCQAVLGAEPGTRARGPGWRRKQAAH